MFLGHVRWFVDSGISLDIPPLNWHEIIFVVAGVGAFLGILQLVSGHKEIKKLFKRSDKLFKKAGPWVPTVTRISLGLLLVINSWNQYFYAPNIGVITDYQQFISWLLGGLGVILLLGILVRSAAITLGVLYLFSFFSGEPILILEHIEYLGLAGYLALAGGGLLRVRILDDFDVHGLTKYATYAKIFIRVGAGMGLSVLAFSEKLLNFSDAQQFLYSYDWNILGFLGVSDRMFIIIAGLIELGVGLSLIFNIGARLSTLMLLGLFVTTAILLGMDEVIGHMFALGVVFAVWADYPKEPKFGKYHFKRLVRNKS